MKMLECSKMSMILCISVLFYIYFLEVIITTSAYTYTHTKLCTPTVKMCGLQAHSSSGREGPHLDTSLSGVIAVPASSKPISVSRVL